MVVDDARFGNAFAYASLHIWVKVFGEWSARYIGSETDVYANRFTVRNIRAGSSPLTCCSCARSASDAGEKP